MEYKHNISFMLQAFSLASIIIMNFKFMIRFTDVSRTITFPDRRFPDKLYYGFLIYIMSKYQLHSVNFVIIKWKMNAIQTDTIMKEK